MTESAAPVSQAAGGGANAGMWPLNPRGVLAAEKESRRAAAPGGCHLAREPVGAREEDFHSGQA